MVISLFVAFLVTLALALAIDKINSSSKKKKDQKKREERMIKMDDDEEEAWASFSFKKSF